MLSFHAQACANILHRCLLATPHSSGDTDADICCVLRSHQAKRKERLAASARAKAQQATAAQHGEDGGMR